MTQTTKPAPTPYSSAKFKSGQRVTILVGCYAGEKGELVDHSPSCVWIDLGDDEPLCYKPEEVR